MSNKLYDFMFRRLDAMQPLRKGLDAYAARQKVYASNIANAETPGYHTRKVAFEDALRGVINQQRSQLMRTESGHIPLRGGQKRMDALQPEVMQDPTSERVNGVNNVDIEAEMAGLATNQIQYSAVSKVLGIRYKMLKSSILGRTV